MVDRFSQKNPLELEVKLLLLLTLACGSSKAQAVILLVQLYSGDLQSKEKFLRLKEAHDVLSDETSRQKYDQQLGDMSSSPQSIGRLLCVLLFLHKTTV